MKPIVFPPGTTDFSTNGRGRLSPKMCKVTEERNGQYELEMDISIGDKHYADVVHESYIYSIHDDTKVRQPFKVYKKSAPMDGIVTVYARHRSYDAMGITVMPYTAENVQEALEKMMENAAGTNPFSVWTDKTTVANFEVGVPTRMRSLLGGTQGSILDVYGGGEYEFDNDVIKLHGARGNDTKVTIEYRKNLTNIKKDTDGSSVWTGVVPYWKGANGDSESETVVTLSEKILYSSYRSNFSDDVIIPLDLSAEFESEPTQAQLRAKARSYITANALQNTPTSIDVSFVQLWQTQEYEQYASLQRLKLCDKLKVRYKDLGVDNEAKIVKVVYDVLNERYESMTVGDVRASLATAISATISAANEQLKKEYASKTFLQKSVERATKLIQGGLGGHIVINTSESGLPNEILCMDTDSLETATNIIRLNMGGIGFSTDGGTTYSQAWTIDGHFVADFIDTGVLNAALITTGYMKADRIQGGTLTLGGANNTSGVLSVKDSSGTEIVIMDKDGLRVKKGVIDGPTIQSKGSYYLESLLRYVWAMLEDGEFRFRDASHEETDPDRNLANLAIRDNAWFVMECLTSNGGVAFSVPGYTEARNNNGGYGLRFYKAAQKGVPVTRLNGALFLRCGSHRGIYWDDLSLNDDFDSCDEEHGIKPYILASSLYGTNVIGGLYVDGNSVSSSSSLRYKENISEEMTGENDPHRLLALKPKTGTYKKEFEYKLQYADMAGETVPMFIAEDVAKIYPSAVIHDKEGNIESWDERRIIPGMLALIQEQEKRLLELERDKDADTQA